MHIHIENCNNNSIIYLIILPGFNEKKVSPCCKAVEHTIGGMHSSIIISSCNLYRYLNYLAKH